MPVLDDESEKIELFDDLNQVSSNFHNRLTEADKINYIHFLMCVDPLQIFKNTSSPTRQVLEKP